MLVFTILSQIPFDLLLKTAIPNDIFMLNVGATLTVGLLSLYVIEKIKNPTLKLPLLFILIGLSIAIPMDYSFIGVLYIIAFYAFQNSKLLSSFAFVIIVLLRSYIYNNLFAMPALLALIPINLFNGKKGKNAKYLFYAFYPLHMLLIVILTKLT